MFGRIVLTALAALGLVTEAAAQEADDWDLSVSDGASQASLSYDNDLSLLVQCHEGRLSVALRGWPVEDSLTTSGDTRWLWTDAVASDGRTDRQTWTQRGTTLTEAWPARTARFFRRGGAVTLTPTGASGPRLELALPANVGNLDRVLSDCGAPLENDRDHLANISHLLTRVPHSRPTGGRDAGRAEVTCIVSPDLRLRDCRVESVTPARSQLRRTAGRALEGVQVEVSDRNAAIGGVLYYTVSAGIVR